MAITLFSADTDDNNIALPFIVRQMLHQTGSQYELDIMHRSALNWRYYDAQQYEKAFLESAEDPVASLQQVKELYEGIRPLFNEISSVVEADRDHTWVAARPEPVKPNEKLQERLKKLWEREGWLIDAKRSTLYSAVDGRCCIRVIPGWMGEDGPTEAEGDPQAPARLEVYPPEICTVLRDQHNRQRVVACKIEYMYTEVGYDGPRQRIAGATEYYRSVNRFPPTNSFTGTPSWNETYHMYTMIITEKRYYTFRDHKMHSFGSLGRTWPNPLGTVPVQELFFNDTGRDSGNPTFAAILPTLDAVNELASMFGNVIHNNSDPVLVAYGIKASQTITKATTNEGTTVWYVPQPPNIGFATNQQPSRLEYLEWKASNLPQMLAFLDMVLEDLRNSLPELHVHKFDKIQSNSGHAVSLQLQRFIQKISNIRETGFLAVERALQMALVSDDMGPLDKQADNDPFEGRKRIARARDDYDLKIIADPPLPADMTLLAQTVNSNVADGIWSRQLGRMRQGMTAQEATVEDERIKKERQDEMEQILLLERLQAEQQMKIQQDAQNAAMQQQVTQGAAVAGQAMDMIKQLQPLVGNKPGSLDSIMILVSELLGSGQVGATKQAQAPKAPGVIGAPPIPKPGLKKPGATAAPGNRPKAPGATRRVGATQPGKFGAKRKVGNPAARTQPRLKVGNPNG